MQDFLFDEATIKQRFEDCHDIVDILRSTLGRHSSETSRLEFRAGSPELDQGERRA